MLKSYKFYFIQKQHQGVNFFRFLDLKLTTINPLSQISLRINKISNQSYLFFGKKTKEATQRTLIKGPGAKLRIIASENPTRDITIPNIEDRIIAIHKAGACCNPNKVGVESKATTRMTPTADIELTITSAVVNPRIKFKNNTLIPLAAAPSGSNPI
tara:strand:+ start:48 stop:518 length:471 start_codon:yes stop_codon:yes gene_type:complete